MTDRSTWEELPLAATLTDDDFEEEYGRVRTDEEQVEHDLATQLLALEDPAVTLCAHHDEEA